MYDENNTESTETDESDDESEESMNIIFFPNNNEHDADSDTVSLQMMDENDLIDELYFNEQHYNIEYTSEEIHQKYFIATYKYIPTEQFLLFVNKIHVTSFFKYNYNVISRYFFWYSGTFIQKRPPVEIIQLFVMPDSTYVCVIKTYYIKIIQRRWKKFFRERKQYILHRMRLNTLYNYTIGKRDSYYAFPGLKGMLTLSLEK